MRTLLAILTLVLSGCGSAGPSIWKFSQPELGRPTGNITTRTICAKRATARTLCGLSVLPINYEILATDSGEQWSRCWVGATPPADYQRVRDLNSTCQILPPNGYNQLNGTWIFTAKPGEAKRMEVTQYYCNPVYQTEAFEFDNATECQS
jgi:hypothetical protein